MDNITNKPNKNNSFEDLEIWNQAVELATIIYKLFGEIQDYGFRNQIQNASVSVASNIAEGFERGTNKDFIRFLYISKASCGEVRSLLCIANKLDYIKINEFEKVYESAKTLSKRIQSFINVRESFNP